jgi:hypothetical protein
MDSHALTRELVELRIRPSLERIRDTLAEPFRSRGARRARLIAALDLFLNLHTWRTLSRTMTVEESVETAVRAVRAQIET